MTRLGKRAEQGALARAPSAPATGAIPPRGRFRILHDPARPLEWTLVLEGAGRAASWSVPRGLPARPDDPRAAKRLGDDATRAPAGGAPWDEGDFRAKGAKRGEVVLELDGARVRGRYAFRRAESDADGAWALARVDPESLRPMRDRIVPMLARAGEYPKDPSEYAFEIKWDGYRGVVYARRDGSLTIRSRSLLDVTADYPELAELKDLVAGHDVVLDGEIVAFDERGLPSFEAMQEAVEGSRVFVAFDVLHLDGHDTTSLPYEERRKLLEELDLASAHVQVSPSHVGDGRALLALPGLEGVVAKRLGSGYEPGARSSAWIKIKTQKRQEFVIGGWSRGKGARGGRIGALLLGVYDERGGTRLRYVGSVGTGFTERSLDDIERKLQTHIRIGSPFDGPIDKKAGDVVFVAPKLVCEVEFTEWTRDGHLRHPSFKGLRNDKDPHHVVREET